MSRAVAEANGEVAAPALSLRDRVMVLGGLAGVAGLAWAYLLFDTGRMQGMAMGDPMVMMAMRPWAGADLLLTFLMWTVMMAAMMLPSVAAAVLLYAAVLRRVAPKQPHARSVAVFVVGYLLVWTVFGFAATGLQWGLDHLALLSPMIVVSSPIVGGTLLIAAGLYQLTPIKQACLKHCRAPLTYLAQHWAYGIGGALRMGSLHGLYCLGCCWAIMLLLFVGGVMNVLWVAVIAIFVLLEKLAPLGGRAGLWLTSSAAVLSGVAMMVLGFHHSV